MRTEISKLWSGFAAKAGFPAKNASYEVVHWYSRPTLFWPAVADAHLVREQTCDVSTTPLRYRNTIDNIYTFVDAGRREAFLTGMKMDEECEHLRSIEVELAPVVNEQGRYSDGSIE